MLFDSMLNMENLSSLIGHDATLLVLDTLKVRVVIVDVANGKFLITGKDSDGSQVWVDVDRVVLA